MSDAPVRPHHELLEHVEEEMETARTRYQCTESGSFEQGQALGRVHAMREVRNEILEMIDDE